MKELKVAQFYPKFLNSNGDFGNILMLKQRAELNNIGFSYEEIDIDDDFDVSKYDFFYIGGAADDFNKKILKEFINFKEKFLQIKEENKTLLGVGFGYQVLGKNYIDYNTQNQSLCLGLLDFFTVMKNKRRIGNVTSRMLFMSPNYLVGFENHKGATYLERDLQPLSYVEIGYGNNGSDKTEGAIENNIIGTYLNGPFLPRNVYFSDYLLKVTMETKYKDVFEPIDAASSLEENVHIDFIDMKY